MIAQRGRSNAIIWTPSLDKYIIRLIQQGKTLREVSIIIQAGQGTVGARLKKLTGKRYSEMGGPPNVQEYQPISYSNKWPAETLFEDVSSDVLANEFSTVKKTKITYPPIGPIKSIPGAQRAAAI